MNIRVSTVTTGGYTGLTTLSTGSLPTGVTASFAPPSLGPNMSRLVTLTTSGSTPSSASIEVRGIATIEGAAVTRTGTTLLNVQGAGQTVLAGQVLDENEKPLAGVTIKLGGTTPTTLGTTDPAGNFLVSLSVAGPQVFLIDGSSANTSTISFPTIPVTTTITAGAVNTLGFTVYLQIRDVASAPDTDTGRDTGRCRIRDGYGTLHPDDLCGTPPIATPRQPRLDAFRSSSGTFGPALRPGSTTGVLYHVMLRGIERRSARAAGRGPVAGGVKEVA